VSQLLDLAQGWTEKNRTLALLGAFAAGVFIGALMGGRNE
jgi:hypothetical protein